ncbi:Omega-amino acid--pyruvate aminotransferase [Caenispirillum salinarum AK4]|uniref:Omega-amino acid--pyruvate aminotransferase n=1 Tax=Caenispirillum salinarum AK4 TaxID=1238182 RepID=K9H2J6_9PROT|nr:aspartate aminotransferase family protein [Caenispirillum salinarum]EKV32480.1 Omega-amino acid--pyruvate aminotransferase [Caenispirillum salinarum AK4]
MTALSASNRTTAEWKKIDSAHHLHPFTDFKGLTDEGGARLIVRAEGPYLYDSEGTKILDGMAGLWCVNVGYGRKELAEAAYAQMQELPYYNTFFKTTTMPATELARQLVELTPEGLNHAFFAGSGSEANDTVIRMVRRYWALEGQPQRQVIIGRRNGYHGSTLAALSLGGMSAMHTQSGILPGFAHIEPPHWFQLGYHEDPDAFGVKAAGWLEDKIQEVGPDSVAAFIAEPIQGAGGLVYPPATYWAEIQRVCHKYGILLIVDEVICGFGRTGNWFGSQTFDIKPDLMPLAKGMSSGYQPIAAVMVGDRVADTLISKGGEFFHGYTYSGHPVACAVALENIRILRDEGIVDRVRTDTGPYFQKRLRELADHPIVGEVRGIGMIAGIELIRDKARHEFFDDVGKVGTIARDHSFANGLIMRAVYDTLVLSPPLILTHDHIDELVEKVRLVLDKTAHDTGVTG